MKPNGLGKCGAINTANDNTRTKNNIDMKRTFENYLIMVGIRSDEYTYTYEQIFGNTEYLKKCYNDNLSAYKALLFLHEHLQELDTSETVALHLPVVSQQSKLLLAFIKCGKLTKLALT